MIDISVSLEQINLRNKGNLGEHLGIEFIEITPDKLVGKMPVDYRTKQPLGMLNGGAAAALAETTGSMAAYLSVDRSKFYTLGLEIKCNHVRSISDGSVYCTAIPVHLGKMTHVWQVTNRDEDGNLLTWCTLTMAVLQVDEQMREKFKDLFFK